MCGTGSIAGCIIAPPTVAVARLESSAAAAAGRRESTFTITAVARVKGGGGLWATGGSKHGAFHSVTVFHVYCNRLL